MNEPETYPIDTDVPMRHGGKKLKIYDTMRKLGNGHSFLVKDVTRSGLYTIGYRLGINIRVSAEGDGFRVWKKGNRGE